MTHDTKRFARIISFCLTSLILVLVLGDKANARPDEEKQTGSAYVPRTVDPTGKMAFWLETSLNRVYPNSNAGTQQSLHLLTPRNARLSFQACYRNESTRALTVDCSIVAPSGIEATVRRVGYVPMWNFTAQVPASELDGIGHIPGLVPDPLYPETSVQTGPWATQSFWITLHIANDIKPGVVTVMVKMKANDREESVDQSVEIDIKSLILQPRRTFPVTHWWNADAIYDWYKVEPFADEWFRLAEAYLRDMIDHGTNVIFVPLFFHRREVVPRPAQLVRVYKKGKDDYSFDWSRVRRFVELARRCGFERFEWPHLWQMLIQPNGYTLAANEPQRIYYEKNGRRELLFPADYPAMGPDYIAFLKQFLPDFQQFLLDENLLEISYFHVSDEPGKTEQDIRNFKAARSLLHQLAPWTDGRVMDAMSDIRYGKMQLIDFPIPLADAASEYLHAGIPHWVYYCCSPRGVYVNRFFDTPLAKIRMAGWLFYRLGALGFLHWGYNFWYEMNLGWNANPQTLINPFTDGAVKFSFGGEGEPYGDSFVVYPGDDGPLDSIRWEVFAESLQDYVLLQSAGIPPDHPLLAPLKNYGDFPKSTEWIFQTIEKILQEDESAK